MTKEEKNCFKQFKKDLYHELEAIRLTLKSQKVSNDEITERLVTANDIILYDDIFNKRKLS